jgi:hypothetical protein
MRSRKDDEALPLFGPKHGLKDGIRLASFGPTLIDNLTLITMAY